jgi:hypothetical protein
MFTERQTYEPPAPENVIMSFDLPFYVISVTKGRERKGEVLAAFEEKSRAEEYAKFRSLADDSGRHEYLAVDEDVARVHVAAHTIARPPQLS